MRESRGAMKAKLQAEAEAIIDELLEWSEEVEKPTLEQIEGVLLKLRKRLSERAAEVMVENQEMVQPAEAPGCPRCGREMRYKGQKEITVESRLGTLHLSRGYYYCPFCKEGFFPLGRANGVEREELE